MTQLLHVIDRTCNETQLQVLQLLCRRLSAKKGQAHVICSIDAGMARRASTHTGLSIRPVHRRLCRFMNWVPSLREVAETTGAEIVHAWGSEAAAACSARLSDHPLVVTLLDPAITGQTAYWVRSFPRHATIVAGSQVIRSRLIAAGVDCDHLVVVRSPADFAAINKARRAKLRSKVVGDAEPVLLMSGPPSRADGQFYGLWAAAILKKVLPRLKMILPYDSPERRRLIRFARQIEEPNLVIIPDSRLSWSELTACADLFVMPATDEVCTEPLGTAMAAGLAVVGVAVRSIAEIIADHHNGLLCKRARPRILAAKILTMIEDLPLRKSLIETARGQAYEVFGIRDFTDNYQRIYENILTGKKAGDNVRDTAMVT